MSTMKNRGGSCKPQTKIVTACVEEEENGRFAPTSKQFFLALRGKSFASKENRTGGINRPAKKFIPADGRGHPYLLQNIGVTETVRERKKAPKQRAIRPALKTWGGGSPIGIKRSTFKRLTRPHRLRFETGPSEKERYFLRVPTLSGGVGQNPHGRCRKSTKEMLHLRGKTQAPEK